MKRNKTGITIAYFVMPLMVIMTLLSCGKDFLNVADKGIIEEELYIINLAATQEYMNGIYTNIASDLNGVNKMLYSEVVADNIRPNTGSTALQNQYKWSQQADQGSGYTFNMNGAYRRFFAVIYPCNLVIEKADAFQSEDILKANLLKGQALSLRAFMYFELVNYFAQSYNYSNNAAHIGVPYVTSSDWSLKNKRITVKEVYDHMVADLKQAIQLLPPSTTSKFQVSQYAAKALLARVYLYMGNFQEAKALAREICAAVPLMNSPMYPAKLFTSEETEALFQLPPESDTYTTSFPGMYFNASPMGLALNFVATKDIVDILRENLNDSRSIWVKNSSGNWLISKFPTGLLPTASYPGGAYYMTILRSSEMYLIASESYFHLNMEDSARYFIDAIRKRANPSIANVTATGGNLLDSIQKERRKELAFEGNRLFDIARWKKGIHRKDAMEPSVADLPYPNDKFIAPIPDQDVKIGSLVQNQGY